MAAKFDISGRTFSLPVDNIDTDQIIPARFLTTTARSGLGACCFYGWRFFEDGRERDDHPLKGYDPDYFPILVAGSNFGCGSSREHAPWALVDFGVRAVISTRFADIFRSNALKNGLLPVTAPPHVVDFLHQRNGHPVQIDIGAGRIRVSHYGEFNFPIDPFSAYCLTQGIDPLEFILTNEAEISRYEQSA